MVPKSIHTNKKINISSITLPKELIKAAKKNKLSITLLVKDEKNKVLYSWKRTGSALAKAKDTTKDLVLPFS